MEKINKLIKAQDMLFNQMQRLDNNDLMNNGNGKREIMRSGAISQSACAFVKSIQTQMKILEMSGKYNVEVKNMNEFLGIKSDE